MGGVAVEVLHEELGGRVAGEVGGEGHVWELADVLGKVEVEAVVGVVSPQGSQTVLSLQDRVWDRELGQAGCDCQTRCSGSDDDHCLLVLHFAFGILFGLFDYMTFFLSPIIRDKLYWFLEMRYTLS